MVGDQFYRAVAPAPVLLIASFNHDAEPAAVRTEGTDILDRYPGQPSRYLTSRLDTQHSTGPGVSA